MNIELLIMPHNGQWSYGKRRCPGEHCGNNKSFYSHKLMIMKWLQYCNVSENKRIKINWSEEDVKILIWVVSKYSDHKNINYIEKELVYVTLSRIQLIGISYLLSFLEFKANIVCSNGWVSRKIIYQIIIGLKNNLIFWTRLSRNMGIRIGH